MSDELRNCPFCGSKARSIWDDGKVACEMRGCEIIMPKQYWNHRPIESALESKLKIAVEALEKVRSVTLFHSSSYAKQVSDDCLEALAKINFNNPKT